MPLMVGFCIKRATITGTIVQENLCASLKVRMKDGRAFSAAVDFPKEEANHLVTREEIRKQFRASVAFSD